MFPFSNLHKHLAFLPEELSLGLDVKTTDREHGDATLLLLLPV
jgi:hypothetical protein